MMNEITSYKRNPTIECWIKHIVEGTYSIEEKFLFTIFGKTKRVRVVSSIIDKREIINPQSGNNEEYVENDGFENLRVEFDLDDGTGLIRAIIWRTNPENYKDFNKGDIIDVIGLIRQWKEFTSISPEIIRKIDEPNYILLRDAEIIKKIKDGEIYDIPEIENRGNNIEDLSSEIQENNLFETNKTLNESNDLKERIYLIIEKYSGKGERISFERLKQEIKLSDKDLYSYLNILIKESRIYESENNNYEAF